MFAIEFAGDRVEPMVREELSVGAEMNK